jgi:vanillate O-demethylase ferredoxin subunit
VLTGSFALGYVGLILAGVALWWPTTRRALKAAFTLDRTRTGRAWNLNLHRTLGACVALVLLFNAATGVTIAFESLRDGYYFLTGSTKDIPPALPNLSPVKFVGYEPILRRIDAQLPHAREIYILPPKRGVVMAGVVAADAPHPNARSYIWFDSTSAEIVRFTPNAQVSAGFRLYSWMISLHTGVTGGLPLKLVLLFACLGVPVLAYTGIASFLRRRSHRASSAPQPTADADVASVK